MKNTKTINLKLTQEEEMLEQSILRGDYISDPAHANQKMWSEAIANHQELSRTKQMTMRVDSADLIKVKVKAQKYGMPYQTLLKLVFKQFADGQIALRI
jgi:predicted DNA binding CopG/RHH family protein